MTLKVPTGLFPAVDAHLADHRLYHSEFQIDHFVTARGGDNHPWGMYVQCLRELHNRRASLQDCENAIAQNEISIEESRWKLGKRVWTRAGKFEKQRETIKLRKLVAGQDSLAKQFRETMRETNRFLEQADYLRGQYGDRPLSAERKQELDQEYWQHRLKLQIASSVLVNGVAPMDVVQMLPGLPAAMRDHLLLFINLMSKETALAHIVSLVPQGELLQLKSA